MSVCETTGCGSASYMVQVNGFCTKCNVETGRDRDLSRSMDRSRSMNSLSSMAPSALDGLGTAFGGRLEFKLTNERGSMTEAFGGRLDRPVSEIIDYQLLRLKFLLNKAVGQMVNPAEIFEHFDVDGSGLIDIKEFEGGLKKLGIVLISKETEALLQRFSLTNGEIAYPDFMAVLGLEEGIGKGTGGKHISIARRDYRANGQGFGHGSGLLDDEFKGLLQQVHIEINRVARAGGGAPRYRKIFQDMDADGNGAVDLAEFMQGLEELGFSLSAKRCAEVAKYFKFKDTDEIDFEDFVEFCEARSAEEAMRKHRAAKTKSGFGDGDLINMLKDIHREINRLAQSGSGAPDFRRVFQSLDRDGDGKLDLAELLEGFRSMGFELNSKKISEVAKVFDVDGDGQADFQVWINPAILSLFVTKYSYPPISS